MADRREWPGYPPGYATRFCPVCAQPVGTHREPVADERRELIVYHPHDDANAASPARCEMSDHRAAIRAVAFTDTAAPGIPPAGRPYPPARKAIA